MTGGLTALIVHPSPDPGLLASLRAECGQVLVLSPSARRRAHTERQEAITRYWYPVGIDPETLARRVQAQHDVDAVVPTWEGTVETTAAISQALGLPGNPPAAVCASRDKTVALDCWRRERVPHPRSALFEAANDGKEAIESEFEYPFIVKIPRSTNSQSVTLVRSRADLARGLTTIQQLYHSAATNRLSSLYSADAAKQPVLVQEYVEGLELNIDLVYDVNDHRVLGVFEKYPMSGPAFAEVQSVYPVALSSRQLSDAIAVAVAAVRALGVNTGAAHVELRIASEGPVVIEAALRGGGFLTPDAVGRLTGLDPRAALFRLLATRVLPDLDPLPPHRACLYGAVNVATAGRVIRIIGADQAARTPGTVLLEVLKKPGDQLVPLPAGTDYHVARFLLDGSTRNEVETAARRIRESVVVELEA